MIKDTKVQNEEKKMRIFTEKKIKLKKRNLTWTPSEVSKEKHLVLRSGIQKEH
ncbi:hypothetical protein RSOCI_05260 [Rhabdochlamydiaceae symbiont of Dictyostelium giganteum]